MKRNVSVDRLKFHCNILISGKIIKEMPGLVSSGTHCIINVTQKSIHGISVHISWLCVNVHTHSNYHHQRCFQRRSLMLQRPTDSLLKLSHCLS